MQFWIENLWNTSNFVLKTWKCVRFEKNFSLNKITACIFSSWKTSCLAVSSFLKKHDFEINCFIRVRLFWLNNFTMPHIFNWKQKNISNFENKLHFKNPVYHLFTPWKRLVPHFLCFLKGMMLKKRFYTVPGFGMKFLQRVRFSNEKVRKRQVLNKICNQKMTFCVFSHRENDWFCFSRVFLKSNVLNRELQKMLCFEFKNFSTCQILYSKLQRCPVLKNKLPSLNSSLASFSSVKTTCLAFSQLLKKQTFEKNFDNL